MPDHVASAAPTAPVTAEPDGFLAEILGAPVLRLSIPATAAGRALEVALGEIVARAEADGVCLVSCRLAAAHAAGVALEAAGFRAIERLQTFRRRVTPVAEGAGGARLATCADADAAAAIAARAFTFDRFHVDPAIPDGAADEIKRRWVLNAFAGRADAIIVAPETGPVAGFILCRRHEEEAVIDLIAVDATQQGHGHGTAMIAAALNHYAGRSATMAAGTQATNAPSIAMYRRLGFALAGETVTYHWTRR